MDPRIRGSGDPRIRRLNLSQYNNNNNNMASTSPKFDNEDIFDLFYRDSSAMKILNNARDYLAGTIEGFLLLKLTSCNGMCPMPFSDAMCVVTRSVGALFHYQTVFRPGFRILDDYLNNKPCIVPEDAANRLVLKRLLTFLMHLKGKYVKPPIFEPHLFSNPSRFLLLGLSRFKKLFQAVNLCVFD